MKKFSHLKLTALAAIAALALIGCGNPAGGSDNHYTGDGGAITVPVETVAEAQEVALELQLHS